MKLSITISETGSNFSPIVLTGDYSEQILKAKKLGYNAIELHIRNPVKIDKLKIIKTLKQENMSLSAIGTGQAFVDEKLCFTSPERNIREKAVRRIKNQIDFASEMGALVIIGTIKGQLPKENKKRKIAMNNARECIKDCVDYAEKAGVKLTLEAINRYETNFLNTAKETVDFIKKINSPNLGLHLDTFHMNIEEVSLIKTFREVADFLVYIHLADSNRWAPGMGHLDFRSIFSVLKEVNYGGYLGVEVLPLPDAEKAAKQALEYCIKW